MKKSIQTKNKLYFKSVSHKTAYNKMQYAIFKSMHQKVMQAHEKTYYNDLISHNKNNMRKTWDVIKNVINRKKQKIKCSQFLIDGCLTDDAHLIANKFNDYFTHIGSNLAQKNSIWDFLS